MGCPDHQSSLTKWGASRSEQQGTPESGTTEETSQILRLGSGKQEDCSENPEADKQESMRQGHGDCQNSCREAQWGAWDDSHLAGGSCVHSRV